MKWPLQSVSQWLNLKRDLAKVANKNWAVQYCRKNTLSMWGFLQEWNIRATKWKIYWRDSFCICGEVVYLRLIFFTILLFRSDTLKKYLDFSRPFHTCCTFSNIDRTNEYVVLKTSSVLHTSTTLKFLRLHQTDLSPFWYCLSIHTWSLNIQVQLKVKFAWRKAPFKSQETREKH